MLAITGFNPSIAVPNTLITVTGAGFDPDRFNNTVRFNGTLASIFSATASALVTRVPNAGSGKIMVNNLASEAVSSADFFIPPFPHTAADLEVAARIAVDGAGRDVELSTADKIALLLFEVERGHGYGVAVSRVLLSGNELAVLRPNGTPLAGPAVVGLGGESLSIPPAAESGTYAVLIESNSANRSDMRLTVSSDITGMLTVDGPNFRLDTNRPGQNARLSFNGIVGQGYGLGISDALLSGSRVSVLQANGSVLVGPKTVGLAGTSLTIPPVAKTGVYTVLVEPVGTSGNGMTLTLSRDVTGTLADGGAPMSINITRPGQNARFTFSAQASTSFGYGLGITDVGSGARSITILGPGSAVLIDSDTVGLGGDGIVIPPLEIGGLHTVLIEPLNTDVGSLTLTVSRDIAAPLVVNGATYTLNLLRPGQNARLTFNGTANPNFGYGLGLTDITINGSRVSILKPNGDALVNAEFIAGSAAGITLDPLAASGTYTLFVQSSGTQTGSMKLTLSSDQLATLTVNGGPFNLNLSRAGQNARLSFAGMAGRSYSLRVNNSSDYSCDVTVLKPDNNVLVGPDFVGRLLARTIDIPALPSTGSYKVVVDPAQADTGSTSLTFTNP